VPFFIAVALILILAQKQITRLVGDHRRGHGEGVGAGALAGAFCCGVYGGYFGAAQGILMLSVLGLSVNDSLQRLNAVKVITTGLTNLVAGVVFVIAAHVAWDVAGLIAGGSIIGGVLGSRYGRRLPPSALRALIVWSGSSRSCGSFKWLGWWPAGHHPFQALPVRLSISGRACRRSRTAAPRRRRSEHRRPRDGPPRTARRLPLPDPWLRACR